MSKLELTVENLDKMNPEEEQQFWELFEKELAHDDGAAAQAHLDAGRPIYYREDGIEGCIREWPGGRREIVTIDNSNVIHVVRPL